MGCALAKGKPIAPIVKKEPKIYKCDKASRHAVGPLLKPKFNAEFYTTQCDLYFTHLESDIVDRVEFYCSQSCVRWEWPPWDLLTGHGHTNIMSADAFDRDAQDCICINRTHKFFEQQPFGRSVVTFYYGDDIHERKHPIRIYEEFTFNDFGQVTFIEAWSAEKGEYLPEVDDDGWPIGDIPHRLSYLIPGLGHAAGEIIVHSEAMRQAAREHKHVENFVERSKNFYTSVAMAHAENKLHRDPLSKKKAMSKITY